MTRPSEFQNRIAGCRVAARIPQHMLEALDRYVTRGIRTGSFLEAALSNDLKGAADRADDQNRHLLWEYAYVFHNHLPIGAWGSPEHFRDWLELKARERAEAASEEA